MTREIRDKRIAVMRDVLAQLDRKDRPLRVGTGNYLFGETRDLDDIGGSLRQYVDDIQGKCQVCMLGATFLSQIRLYNGAPSSVLRSSSGYVSIKEDAMRKALECLFDERTLDLMESAFERRDVSYLTSGPRREAECDAAADFGSAYATNEGVARAIATNIITNDGEFIIPVASPA